MVKIFHILLQVVPFIGIWFMVYYSGLILKGKLPKGHSIVLGYKSNWVQGIISVYHALILTAGISYTIYMSVMQYIDLFRPN